MIENECFTLLLIFVSGRMMYFVILTCFLFPHPRIYTRCILLLYWSVGLETLDSGCEGG